jgi:uncharacterized membrane protein YqgA involved in biofilm formation
MKKEILFAIIILLAFVLGMLVGNIVFTGKTIEDFSQNYSYSTAICNSEKQCIDILVFCAENEVVNLEPVTELRDFSDLENWQENSSVSFCNRNN